MKFKNSLFGKTMLLLMAFLIIITSMAAVKEYRRLHNLRVKGWLFGDTDRWSQIVTWTYSGTLDTVELGTIDTTCIVLVSPLDSTYSAPIDARVSRNGDSIFVECDSTVHASNKYSLVVIRP